MTAREKERERGGRGGGEILSNARYKMTKTNEILLLHVVENSCDKSAEKKNGF